MRSSASLIGLLAGLAAIGLVAGPAAAQQAGVAAAVNADSLTRPPAAEEQVLVVGHNVVFDEKITTGPAGQAQLLMLDQSAVTVAPNSELVIDRFVYDPETKTGELAMSLSRGLMRFVGGRLSKSGNVMVNTPTATMGIRGGIALVDVPSQDITDVTMMFGEGVEGETSNGQSFAIRRNGYFTRIQAGVGASPPAPASGAALGSALARLQGREGADGGAEEQPTDESATTAIGDTATVAQVTTDVGADASVGSDASGDSTLNQDLADQNAEQQVQVPPNPANNSFNQQQLGFSSVRFSNGLAVQPTARVLTVVDPEAGVGQPTGESDGANAVDGVNPDNFAHNTRLFAMTSADSRTLASRADAGALSFSLNGVGDPDQVPNIFQTGDANVYQSPTTFNANAPTALAGNNIRGFDFFDYDLTTANFDGSGAGARINLNGGVPLATRPTGMSFFEANGDTATISFLPFSDIGRFQLPPGGGLTGFTAISDANVTRTPFIVDWDNGKALGLSSVFQDIGGANPIYGVEVVVGNVVNGDAGPEISGTNAGSSHAPSRGTQARLFHSGSTGGAPLGAPATGLGLSLDGDHVTVRHLDGQGNRPDGVTTFNHQFGAQTTAIELGAAGTGTTSLPLYAAGIVADVDGEITNFATPNQEGPLPGTLAIDRDARQVVANFILEDDFGDISNFANAAQNSAFFDMRTFGVASPQTTTQPGIVVISEAGLDGLPQPCDCAFVTWGAWAGGEVSPGDAANAVSDIGFFFAGAPTPTVDMPVSGSASYSGGAYASMQLPGQTAPTLATGAFTMNTNFASGISSGQVGLNDQSFSLLGRHTVGAPELRVDYIRAGQTIGHGDGAFMGSQAANVGVTIDIDDGAGLRAGGVAIGERQ